MKKTGSIVWSAFEGVLRFVVFRVLHIKLQEDIFDKFLQFVKFAVVGFSNVMVSYFFYLIFFGLFQIADILPNVDYLIAQLIGYVLSIFWSFYWNRKYVFAQSADSVLWYQALIKSFVAYSFTGVLLNSILSFLWVELMGMSKVIAPIINLVINVPINFVMNKFWAFRRR